jgi:hypothetical protein
VHRRRYLLGRFLLCNIQEDMFNPKHEEPHNEKKEEEPFGNPFAGT